MSNMPTEEESLEVAGMIASNAKELEAAHRDFLATMKEYHEKFESRALTAEQVYTGRLLRLEKGAGEPIFTGVWWWDEFVGPFRRGNSYLLSGYPGVGKTTLILNLLWEIAKTGRRVWYYCLELTAEEAMEVLIGIILKKAKLSEADWTLGYATIQSSPFLFFEPAEYLTWEQHLALIAKTVRKEKMELVVIDNLSFLTRVVRNQNEVEGVASAKIKSLSQELAIPIVLLHHLRKPDTDKGEPDPTPHTVRGSGLLLADASDSFILHHPLIEDEDGLRHEVGFLMSGKPRWGMGGKRYVCLERGTRKYDHATAMEYPRALGNRKVRK